MRFYDLFQKETEPSSGYLQRLQLLIRRIVDSGEIDIKDEFLTLVKQFRRGCRDDTMLHQMDIMASLDDIQYKD